MLSKLILSLALAIAPVVAIPASQATQVATYEGGWSDGTTFLWQCAPGSNGKFRFMFILPTGQTYEGIASCGTAI